MNFLSGKVLGMALQMWRNAKGLKPSDIVDKSKTGTKKGLAPSYLHSIEQKGKNFSYKKLVEEVFPAYGIKDICDYDLFLDCCVEHSVETISFISADDWDIRNRDKTKEKLVAPEKLRSNRSRISIIEIFPGGRTHWQRHEGHEFVLVVKGTVRAKFADSRNGEPVSRILEKEDGVAFSSSIYHSFINEGEDPAELVIARPTNSLPKGMVFQDEER